MNIKAGRIIAGSLAAVVLITGVMYLLYSRGDLLPSWIEWESGCGSFAMGSENADIVLENKEVRVSFAEEMIRSEKQTGSEKSLWRSDPGCRVSAYRVGDVDHDGENELVLLFWRRGSFKKHLPFWIEKNDNEWSQHIGVYDWKEDYPYRLDPAWVSSKLGINIKNIELDGDGVVNVVSAEGEKTRWYWRTFGLMLLEDGEVPCYYDRKEPESGGNGEKAEKKSLTFTASGDNLIHGSIYKAAAEMARQNNEEGYDFGFAYEDVEDFFGAHDVNFINIESMVSDTLEASDYPYFSTPGECAEKLMDIGFNAFNLSNNHIYDHGEQGLYATSDFWKRKTEGKDIAVFGLYDKNDSPDYLSVNGIRLAFLGYTYGTNGNETPDGSDLRVIYLEEKELIKKQLEEARKNADLVIVSCHFGIEGSHKIRDEERTLAKALANWGADIVIGTHPHVVKDAQWFNTTDGRKALVCYSLGNFISSMKRTGYLTGLTLECRIDLYEEGPARISDVKLIPNVTVYGPYYSKPHVLWLSDYSSEEMIRSEGQTGSARTGSCLSAQSAKQIGAEEAQAGSKNYRDIDYSYDRIIEILKSNVSEEFLVMPSGG